MQDKGQILEDTEKCQDMKGITTSKDKDWVICIKKINYIKNQDFRQWM